MLDWLNALSAAERVFLYVAAPASLVMVIQTVMLFFGASDSGLDSDVSGLGGADLDAAGDFDAGGVPDAEFYEAGVGAGLQFITLRGVIVLLTVFGWTGLCAMQAGLGLSAAVALAAGLGLGALIGVAYLVRAVLRLQAVHPLNYRAALGQSANVYLTIPPKGEGSGKVMLTLGGALREYDAVTHGDAPIKTGQTVRVTDLTNGSVMVVEKE
ncbi:MAG: hypothetical protein FWG93_04555 [Oscillospiraceae bacterium]|nr:hypothetical protein [Oscillospiraceae bacterium]